MNDFTKNEVGSTWEGRTPPPEKPANPCTCKNPHIEPQWSSRSYVCVICGNDYIFDGTTSGKLQDIGTIGKREIGFNPNVSNRFYNFNPRIVLEDGTVIPIAEFKKIQSELEFTATEIEREQIQSWIGEPFRNYDYNVISVDTQAPKEVAVRPDWDTTFMEVAQVVAKRGTCPRLKVGAVITADNKIISTGYNGAPAGTDHCTEVGCLVETETGRCKRTVHAEINAIIQAGSNTMARNTTLYTTHFPCVECASVIANSDIDRVVYMANSHYDASKTERATEILKASFVEIEEWLPF